MKKDEQKLMKYNERAQHCTSREEAQAILKKYSKAKAKLMVKRLLAEQN